MPPALNEMQSFFFGGHFLWNFFRASLGKFGQKSFLAAPTFMYSCVTFALFVFQTGLLGYSQGCAVGGKISDWLLKSMEIVVHRKKSVSTKVLKEIAPFQQELPT